MDYKKQFANACVIAKKNLFNSKFARVNFSKQFSFSFYYVMRNWEIFKIVTKAMIVGDKKKINFNKTITVKV